MTCRKNEAGLKAGCLAQKACRKNKPCVFGVGVDIEDISRFKKKPFAENNAFYKKIFTGREIKYCLPKPAPWQHFAARFCAKEAFVKALGKKMPLKGIEVLRAEGKPCLKVKGFKNLQAHVSMSHAKGYAIAFVVLEKTGELQ